MRQTYLICAKSVSYTHLDVYKRQALGLPVSTTHAKTAAILGVGGRADRGVVRSILLTWIFTFPGCGLIGFFTAKCFLSLFS